jgi:putative aldouronate transport system permease protein
VSTSLIGVEEWARRGSFILIPEKIDLSAYRMLLGSGSIVFNAYKVTLFRVFVGTALNLFFTTTAAYVLARRNLPGRTFLTLIVFIPMVFSGGLIPTFVLIDSLGLLNSLWALIIPSLVNPWWLLIMRNFFMGLPYELEEAAIMDGATPPVILWKIILPLSLPSLSTIGLFYAVMHWNAWFDAAIYLKDQVKYPIQLVLRAMIYLGDASYRGEVGQMIEPEFMPPAQTLKSAAIIVSTIPILVVYPFIQKYFVKGALVGAVKG